MATLNEIAQGIAQLLGHTSCPDPLPVDLTHHSREEVIYLIRAVIEACDETTAGLSEVRVGARFGNPMTDELPRGHQTYRGVPIRLDLECGRQVLFCRAGASPEPTPSS